MKGDFELMDLTFPIGFLPDEVLQDLKPPHAESEAPSWHSPVPAAQEVVQSPIPSLKIMSVSTAPTGLRGECGTEDAEMKG